MQKILYIVLILYLSGCASGGYGGGSSGYSSGYQDSKGKIGFGVNVGYGFNGQYKQDENDISSPFHPPRYNLESIHSQGSMLELVASGQWGMESRVGYRLNVGFMYYTMFSAKSSHHFNANIGMDVMFKVIDNDDSALYIYGGTSIIEATLTPNINSALLSITPVKVGLMFFLGENHGLDFYISVPTMTYSTRYSYYRSFYYDYVDSFSAPVKIMIGYRYYL